MTTKEDFEIKIADREEDKSAESRASFREQTILAAEQSYDPENRAYSAYLADGGSAQGLSYDELETLSLSPQSDLSKTQRIISISRQYVNKDDLIGITAESIENNVNTEVRFAYPSSRKKSIAKAQVEKARALIADFNEKINLKRLIVMSISTAYRDGTFIACRRKVQSGDSFDYVVDYFPVGVALVSTYDVGGDPYVLIDIAELKTRLQKVYPKTKKRRGVFFDGLEDELKAAYPEEVYKAYRDKEAYAKLDIVSSCVIRVNNQNKQYGLSPIFRAMESTLMLENFAKADRKNAQARAKKIIVQYLQPQIMGSEFNKDTYSEQAVAHKTLMEAWKQPTVVMTAPATVRAMQYVEPKADMTNIETVNYYRTRVMSTLGISFLVDSGSQSLSVANISVKQLMRTINKISSQLETVLVKWYKDILADNGISAAYAPTVSIIDAEMMEMALKVDLVNALFTKLNCSYETAYEMLGMSYEDERRKREDENKEKTEEIFRPRLTAYTASGSADAKSAGRPPAKESTDPDKQAYDKEVNGEDQ